MSQDFNENFENDSQNPSKESEYVYKNVMGGKQNKRTWSIISLILAIASVPFCAVPIVGLILGLLSIGAAIYSRKCIGYFDGFSLAGLMIGIFGAVFSVGVIILRNMLINLLITLFK
ncbi:MAG: DUF4190 domain-containing protein [Clostridia bacterium]|nr:DUF4190 domain-containing protein [Clostridia bacterium]